MVRSSVKCSVMHGYSIYVAESNDRITFPFHNIFQANAPINVKPAGEGGGAGPGGGL